MRQTTIETLPEWAKRKQGDGKKGERDKMRQEMKETHTFMTIKKKRKSHDCNAHKHKNKSTKTRQYAHREGERTKGGRETGREGQNEAGHEGDTHLDDHKKKKEKS